MVDKNLHEKTVSVEIQSLTVIMGAQSDSILELIGEDLEKIWELRKIIVRCLTISLKKDKAK